MDLVEDKRSREDRGRIVETPTVVSRKPQYRICRAYDHLWIPPGERSNTQQSIGLLIVRCDGNPLQIRRSSGMHQNAFEVGILHVAEVSLCCRAGRWITEEKFSSGGVL